ncbi:MAG TPA: hypothetical protein VEP73_07460 [Actinomycetota bacterium]|nr:hypothetical protein [Actinomycetota bacterium]
MQASTGGITDDVPVASTTARRAVRRRTGPSAARASTTRAPASLPAPRTSSMPLRSSQGSWPSSCQLEVM